MNMRVVKGEDNERRSSLRLPGMRLRYFAALSIFVFATALSPTQGLGQYDDFFYDHDVCPLLNAPFPVRVPCKCPAGHERNKTTHEVCSGGRCTEFTYCVKSSSSEPERQPERTTSQPKPQPTPAPTPVARPVPENMKRDVEEDLAKWKECEALATRSNDHLEIHNCINSGLLSVSSALNTLRGIEDRADTEFRATMMQKWAKPWRLSRDNIDGKKSLPDGCIAVESVRQVSNRCNARDVAMFETKVRTVPIEGCPREIEVTYLDPEDLKWQFKYVYPQGTNILTCTAGAQNIHFY